MKKLTKATALAVTLLLWKWLAETGGVKDDWPVFKAYKDKPMNLCFLCEYDLQRSKATNSGAQCTYCPYHKHFGHPCYEDDNSDNWDAETAYGEWERATEDNADAETLMHLAAEFVKELEEL